MNIDKLLKRLKLNEDDFLTIMWSEEADYYRIDLETLDGLCYSVEVAKDVL